MFDYSAWEASLRSHIYSELALTSFDPDSVVAWPNRKFETPAATQHLRVFITFDDAEQIDLGDTGSGTVHGAVTLRLYTPAGAGAQAHETQISTLAAILHAKTVDAVACLQSVARGRGRIDRWWVTDVETPFEIAH